MIKLKAVINESETDRLIRELSEENKNLKKLLRQYELSKDVKQQQNIKEQIKEVEEIIEDTNFENKRKNTVDKMVNLVDHDTTDYSKVVHIVNLNEDPQLSRKLIYNMEKIKALKVGRQKSDENRIVLNGVNIKKEHCIIQYEGN